MSIKNYLNDGFFTYSTVEWNIFTVKSAVFLFITIFCGNLFNAVNLISELM